MTRTVSFAGNAAARRALSLEGQDPAEAIRAIAPNRLRAIRNLHQPQQFPSPRLTTNAA